MKTAAGPASMDTSATALDLAPFPAPSPPLGALSASLDGEGTSVATLAVLILLVLDAAPETARGEGAVLVVTVRASLSSCISPSLPLSPSVPN